MERIVPSTQVFRFGQFEADPARNTLTRKGVPVKVQDQPFRVLILLLERAGELVTREELRQRLWPEGTFVDFDGSLNVTLKKLRTALDDDSDNPRFVETVPRRGYRFIAPVSEISRNPVPALADAIPDLPPVPENPATSSTELIGESTPPRIAPPPPVSSTRPTSRSAVILSALTLVLLLAGVAYFVRPHLSSDSGAQKRVMLAILPFQNLSNDPSQEYFSDGLTEETITDLGQLSPERLGVIARTSAMAYKHTDKTVSQIGRELGVDYILEGSVRREGEKVRISAQLIRVKDQTHLWAANYDRELKDLIAVQNDLGQAIAQQVPAKLTSQTQTELSATRPVNPEAYDLYLRGRYYWNQRTPQGIKQSIGYFQQALAKDPNFALAYSGLADAYNISNIVGAYTPKESLPQARAAAEKAIELDPSLAEAHAALGMEKSHYDFDFPGAEREFLKAIQLNPNSAYAHLFYSNCYLMPMGRVQEAIAENKKALELDPLSLPINNFMGMTYYFADDYDASYRQFQHTIEMDPTFPLAHLYFALLLLDMGKYEQSFQEEQTSALLSGTAPQEAAALAASELKAYRQGGPSGFWQWNLEATRKQRQSDGSVFAGGFAAAYARVGDKDKVFEWLDKAYEAREGQDITLVKRDPAYKHLRSDPRFATFLRRMGLPADDVPSTHD
jgi:TolB-like protein/DNA-binding winged helix-turn-helix (wHTH) protein